MEKNLKKCMDYVAEILLEAGCDLGEKHPFRSRIRHIRRVLRWAERLCEGLTDVDTEVLYTAVIFHDIGYADEEIKRHQKASEIMFREYAMSEGLDYEFTEKVAACISIHSDKERLQEPDSLTIEQILLMEADLLDEEGALSICWDGMACGYEGKLSYEKCLQRTLEEFQNKKNKYHPITEKGKQFWNEKLTFIQSYIAHMKHDLDESHLF